MKMPSKPPAFSELLASTPSESLGAILDAGRRAAKGEYLHWDKLRHLSPPTGLTHLQWWTGIKLHRLAANRSVPLRDKSGGVFEYNAFQEVEAALHQIDQGVGGKHSLPEPVTNPHTRDRYIVSTQMEEAITSSQLEGAATTRQVAKEMIRSGRSPRDASERMILNNYNTMRRITELKDQALTPDRVFEIHRLVTHDTLEKPDAGGRFRRADENIRITDLEGTEFHLPPPAAELPQRLVQMCDFANGGKSDAFIHPVLRAIILHFWLAYDHPFVDGNGRTARALFYWAMLRQGYWLFEFVSISHVLRKAPAQYARSFLYTETDGNDLTYFILAQLDVIKQAIRALHVYVERKTSETKELESHLRVVGRFNHRQAEIIRHALKHLDHRYTIESHQRSHDVTYQTARTDLLGLASNHVLEQSKRGRTLVFTVPRDIEERLRKLENRRPRK